MKIRFNNLILSGLLAASVLTQISCKKNDVNNVQPNTPDLITKVNTSVSGFVTDENDLAVANATVTAGNRTVMTDIYGYFEIKDVQLVKLAARVSVMMPGYFKSTKTWQAKENKSAFFRMKLIPGTSAGNFSSASGGQVTLASGLNISMPANAVVTASGAAYSGTVYVSAHLADIADTDSDPGIPGDQRGINSNGDIKLLKTLGVAGIELTGSAGEPLQIATGKKASITIPFPASMATAPATVPLWHFDETNGLWKEEGTANRMGGNYIAEVSHFSWWHVAPPTSFVTFEGTFLFTGGHPYQNAIIAIHNNAYGGYGYTDENGYISGVIPQNESLELIVTSEWNCGQPHYTQNITTGTTPVTLGIITVPSTNMAVITGNLVNCNSNPVTNGSVLVRKHTYFARYAVSSNGSFTFATSICNANLNIILVGEDLTTLQQGGPFSYYAGVGNNNVGTISACGTTTQEFLNYSVDGVNYSFTMPADSVRSFTYTPTMLRVSANNFTNTRYANFVLDPTGIGVGTYQSTNGFISTETGNLSPVSPVLVHITEYGLIGEYIAGNFIGTFSNVGNPNNYNLAVSFRVRRIN